MASLCAAIVHADDVALMERQASGMGPVFQDMSLSSTRRPRWLRRSVQNVAGQYAVSIMPPEVKWQNGLQSPDIP